jgi:hypothetical protein
VFYVVVDNIWQHSPVAECWLVGHSMGEIDVGIDARVNKNLGNHYKYNHFWPKNQQKMHLMKKCSSSAYVIGFWNKMGTTDTHHPLRSETKRTRTLQRPGWNSLVVWPLVGGAIAILKNDGVRQWEGWHPIYEMANISSPPTSGTSHHKPTIYDWNHQPDQECRVHWVHRTGTSWIVGLKQLNVIVSKARPTNSAILELYWFC